MFYQDRLRTKADGLARQAQDKHKPSSGKSAFFSVFSVCQGVFWNPPRGKWGITASGIAQVSDVSLQAQLRKEMAKHYSDECEAARRTDDLQRKIRGNGRQASFACLRHFIATENDLFFHQDRLGTSIKGNSKEEGRLLLFVKLCTFTDAHGGRPGTRWLRLNFPTADEVREGKRRGMPDIYQERAAAAQVPACSREHMYMQPL